MLLRGPLSPPVARALRACAARLQHSPAGAPFMPQALPAASPSAAPRSRLRRWLLRAAAGGVVAGALFLYSAKEEDARVLRRMLREVDAAAAPAYSPHAES